MAIRLRPMSKKEIGKGEVQAWDVNEEAKTVDSLIDIGKNFSGYDKAPTSYNLDQVCVSVRSHRSGVGPRRVTRVGRVWGPASVCVSWQVFTTTVAIGPGWASCEDGHGTESAGVC